MSSTSLSPAPSEASTSRVPRSPLKPVKFLHPNTYIAPKSVKRRRAPSSELYPPAQPKRIRDGTPICQEAEDSTSGDRPAGGQNASVPAYTTTAAGPSSYAAQEDDPGLVAVTSDGGEGSVLFSENAAIGTKGKTTIMDGDIGHRQANGSGRRDDAPAGDDFLPEEGVDGHGDGEDLGEEPREDGSEGEDEACEEDGGAHEESQDQNDVNEEDEDGAEPPAWLKEPQIISSRALPDSWSSLPLDRMSRVLEAKMEPEPKPRPALSHHIASWAEVPNAEDKEVLSDDPPASPSSYHSGDSDDFVMAHRPILERTEIKRDIKAFVSSLGTYGSDMFEPLTGLCRYPVIDRLGEGTFSSVYLARDRQNNLHWNEYWSGEPAAEENLVYEDSKDKVVALKKILATSSPQRIENELHILESLRGCRNVSQLINAFREDDQVIIVLPFHRSDDFRHFYRHMDPSHTRLYMRALLAALKDIHKRGIVHRDVKPANFLFDYETGDGVLCDFGLAERYVPPRKPSCQHAPDTSSFLQGSKVKTAETSTVEQAVYDARKRSKLGEGRIGFLQEDKRPTIKTNRAGTRGFRAPEVLLKCPDQTVAIDVWSAGIMLLSILTHKFPVFNSSDDIEALMEIAAIFGRPAMERCALLHNRTIISNVPSVDNSPPTLTSLVLKLNPHIFTPPMHHPSPANAKAHIEAVDDAVDLCTRLLRPDATKRLTAAGALRHPFLRPMKGESMEDMVEEEPLGGEDGKCGYLHGVEEGKHRAFFSRTLEDMQFGQGIPPTRDQLCPEHEHWQLRMYNNPLVSCQRFDDDEEGSETGDDEEETGDEEQEEHGDEELFVEEKIEKRNGRVALAEKNANVVTEGLRPARRVKA